MDKETKKVEEHVDAKALEMQKAFEATLAPLAEALEKANELIATQAESMQSMEARLAKSEKSSLKTLLVGGEEKELGELEEDEVSKVFAKALFTGDEATLRSLESITVKNQNETTNADGGYTVPAPLANEILEIASQFGIVMPLVETVNMASRTLDITSLVKTGVSLTWEDEYGDATETDAEFGRVVLTAYKIRGKVVVTTELVEDSAFDIVNVIKRVLGEELAVEMDNVICQGTGTSQPEGIFVNATIDSAKSTGALTYDVFVNIKNSIDPINRRGASWLINTQEIVTAEKLKDTTNRPLWREGLAEGSPTTFMGFPAVESTAVPAGKLAFGNFKKAYWVGTRSGLTVELDKDYDKDATNIYIRRRVAGKPVLPGLIKRHDIA